MTLDVEPWSGEALAAPDAENDLAQWYALSPAERVAKALRELPGAHVLSSSFGAQSAVMLHLVLSQAPHTPVVLVDTGYLFPETYRFIDDLQTRFNADLRIYRPAISAAHFEARHGKLWEQGLDGIERYNQFHKVEPFQRALEELHVGTWFSGLRRSQSASRAAIEPVEHKRGRIKVHPLFDQSNRDLHQYLQRFDLPYHPLWDEGYVSIGDTHTTRPLSEGISEEATRFFGLKRECGLHG